MKSFKSLMCGIFIALMLFACSEVVNVNKDDTITKSDASRKDTIPETPETPPATPSETNPLVAEVISLNNPLISELPDIILLNFQSMRESIVPCKPYSSNYRDYADCEGYKELLDYCKQYGKASLPLVISAVIDKLDFTGINLLTDLALPEYQSLLDQAKKETASYSVQDNFIYFSYLLLKQEQENILEAIKAINP
ncbi:hypothetical protein FACS1894181_13120 [Bacteroidia bacterium]|nr:hypothetical protein FACS1894181_13120 [Bacteroidia bacterium]